MNLATNRFYQSDTRFRGADGRVRDATVYSYEAAGTLYDVLIIEGMKYVRTNGGQLSGFITEWRQGHYDVERHFELSHAGPNPSIHA